MAGQHSDLASNPEGIVPRFMLAANLGANGIRHGFFMRTGGVSEGVYASLNCGRGSKDNWERVEENRARAAALLGILSEELVGPRQIHSARAVVVSGAWQPDSAPEADAIVTSTPGLALSVLTADCAPVLMADREAGVIAAIHAGWKGAKAGVIESAVAAMESLGAKPRSIAAAIGPTISQTAYEVGPDFKAAFAASDEGSKQYFEQGAGDRPHFDLAAYVKRRLLCCGLTNIEDLGVCTYENESILFSFRRSSHRYESDYGRQISAILIR